MERFEILTSCQEFFKDRVESASRRVGVLLSVSLQFYLVNLLASLATKELPNFHEPVFNAFQSAVEALPGQKIKYYKDMGDSSLLISGVFPQVAIRRNVSIDYYVDMGQMGYYGAKEVSEKVYRDYNFGELYGELGGRFKELKTVLRHLDFEGRESNVYLLLRPS